ncbi:putative transcription factor bHLH107 [Ricinus communis]|uniref:BHLH domain-containing protein n=1 Tax=Ricinus communis TaxID=3988 RepID=B9SGJ7_RICCO|nr:putative transcription factor bHLH107 [Ricinus communis]EEF37243.1 conserved hypothetical protein [Ricinus communis]|eukprot:XP_002525116.1 putative transcription factor bHLH107 [Ricinus communis]
MEHHSLSSNLCTDLEGFSDEVFMNTDFEAKIRNGLCSTSSLVLDSQRGELVEATVSVGKKGVSAERSTQALRNHCEAERKRRARINAHLDTLRSLVPGAKKMDKASLLAEVIKYMKELKMTAAGVSEGLLMPMDVDEVRVEGQDDKVDGAPCMIRISLCCDYKPGLLSDLRRALDALHLIVMRSEIATLEGRMKNVLVMTSCKEAHSGCTEVHKLLACSVQQAIRSILDKFSASHELSLKSTLSHKRQRVSLFDPHFSSSSGDIW